MSSEASAAVGSASIAVGLAVLVREVNRAVDGGSCRATGIDRATAAVGVAVLVPDIARVAARCAEVHGCSPTFQECCPADLSLGSGLGQVLSSTLGQGCT